MIPSKPLSQYRYKVHSAVYAWGEDEHLLKVTHDVTKVAQDVLDSPSSNGIIHINEKSFKDPAPGYRKSFAILVTIVHPDGNQITRFCTCLDGTSLRVKDSGVLCYL